MDIPASAANKMARRDRKIDKRKNGMRVSGASVKLTALIIARRAAV